jgi:hypothetical protein
VKVTVLGGAPGVAEGLVSTIGVPLRNPFISEVEFSVDPAIGVKEDTSFDSGTDAVAGLGLVEVSVVVPAGSAIASGLPNIVTIRKIWLKRCFEAERIMIFLPLKN